MDMTLFILMEGMHTLFIQLECYQNIRQYKGFGSKLLEFLKDCIKSHGFFEMFVMTDKCNPRTCHVYEKIGGENEICYVVNFEGDK